MKIWSVLDHKIEQSESKEQRLFNKNIMEDAIMVVEDKWLVFVSQNLEIVHDVLDYTFVGLVWRRRKGDTFEPRRFDYQYQYHQTVGEALHLI
jgi:hypothetical protein